MATKIRPKRGPNGGILNSFALYQTYCTMQSIITTQFSPDELAEIIRLAVTEAITAYGAINPPPKEPHYLSRKQTAAKLGVTLTTLWERTRQGEITAHKFGSRVLYKPSDVEAALCKVNVSPGGVPSL